MTAWHGQQVTERATCLVAANPGPMTLDGTNTYVLAEPGSSEVLVVDPGPDDRDHLDAVVAAAEADGRRVALILLTHRHLDHSAGADALSARVAAPVRAADPALCRGAEPLVAGEVEIAGLRLTVVPTPGHTADSVCFALLDDGALLTGDTVLGRGTTVVAYPDGGLGDYLASLDLLADLIAEHGLRRLLPGHGPVGADPGALVTAYQAHRVERLEQVRAAVAAGATTPMAVVETVYAEVDRAVWPAAEQSVRAQLDYLRDRGS